MFNHSSRAFIRSLNIEHEMYLSSQIALTHIHIYEILELVNEHEKLKIKLELKKLKLKYKTSFVGLFSKIISQKKKKMI